MSNWNHLLQALDDTLGSPNKVESTVKKVNQFFDPTTNRTSIVELGGCGNSPTFSYRPSTPSVETQ